jgi:hypothetical protein
VSRRWALATVAVLLLAACGPVQVQRAFQQPTCEPSDVIGLMAQAVPTSRFLPCIAQFPAGWMFDSSEIKSNKAIFWMDSDRAGMKAVEVTLTRTCDTSGTPIPSDEPGTRLFVRAQTDGDRYVGTRYYLFSGGCITYNVDLPKQQAPVLSTEVSTAIGMLPRAVLVEAARRIGLKV